MIVNRMQPQNRENFYKFFIPSDFPYQVIDEQGAGQQRLIGKVKLYDQDVNGSTNDQVLHDKIAGYFQGTGSWADKREKKVNILLLTGISGGNGSGTFLNIAAIAKNACPNPLNAYVYSYIMLPDTAEGFATSEAQKKSLYGNGFAALKELESYESFFMEPGREENFYSRNSVNDIRLSAASQLINYPVLISGNYDEAVSMIAETIVNSIASSSGFTEAFFYCNAWVRENRLSIDSVSQAGVLKAGACPEDSHMYNGIGYAKAEIPERIVLPYVVSAVSEKLYTPQANNAQNQAEVTAFCSEDHALDKADYEKELRYLLGLNTNTKLEPRTLWNSTIFPYLKRISKVRDNTSVLTYNDIAGGNVEQYYKGFAEEAAKNEAVEEFKKFLKDQVAALLEKCKVIMKKYGPRAIVYLYDGVGNFLPTGKREVYGNGLKDQISYVSDQLLNIRSGKQPPRLSGRSVLDILGRKKDVVEWCGLAKAATEQDVLYKLAELMRGDNGIWKRELVDKLENFLASTERFTDAMEEISAYYAGVGISLATDDFKQFAEAGSARNSVNLCTNADVYDWVKQQISKKITNVDIGKVRSALVDDFYTYTEQWISSSEGVARQRFDEIMSAALQIGSHAAGGNGMSLGISDYFDYVLDGITNANDQQTAVMNAVRNIYNQLQTKSSPSLKLKPGTEEVINRYILLPDSLKGGKSGELIKNAFDNCIRGEGTGSEKEVYFSSVTDAIVCYQTSVANAISDLKDLDLWENAYENHTNTQHLNNGEYPRLHMDTGFSQYKELDQAATDRAAHQDGARESLPLDEAPSAADQNLIYGTGLSWFDYPSINYARYADDFTNSADTTESKYRSGLFTKRVREALRIGVIERVKAGFTYKYFLNLIPSDWTNLGVGAYRNMQNGRFVRGQVLFQYLKGQNPASDGGCRKQICISESPFFGADGFDFTQKANLDNWTEDKADRQAELYMMRILRKATELYQEMEDTMYRFYPVEYDLEKKEAEYDLKKKEQEQKQAKLAQYRNFADWVLYGVITCDDDGMYWSVRTTARGNAEDLMNFGRRSVAMMDKDQKRLLTDGIRLKLVYDSFMELRQELGLTDGQLDQVKNTVINSLSDTEFDQMMDRNLTFVQNELDVYNEKYGKQKDPLDAIMNAYEADDDQLDQMQEIVDLYGAVGNAVKAANAT